MTQLGKYEILKEIGRGGFGVVYKARDHSLDRIVALKVLHPQLTVDPGFITRFHKEAQALARINHPNVVTVYEIGEINGKVYIAMEYLPGGSLAEKLVKGPLPYETALRITQEVSAGLQAGHNKGLIHRDVKPGNILFNEHGDAVIVDLGLAKAMQVSSSTVASSTGTVGTPNYRAPELWNGTPPPEPATDVYSLACVFFEMLTGEVLFSGDTPSTVMLKHFQPLQEIEKTLARFSELNPEIMKKAIAKDPKDRFPNPAGFAQALQTSSHMSSKKSDAKGQDNKEASQKQISRKESETTQTFDIHIPLLKTFTIPKWTVWVSASLLGVGLLGLMMWFGRDRFAIGRSEEGSLSVLTTPIYTQTPTTNLTLAPNQTRTTAPTPNKTLMLTGSVTHTLNPTATLGVGSTKINTKDNAEMVYVPAGGFFMGAVEDDTMADSDEKPRHAVILDAYWIYKHEVTNARYRDCIEEGKCSGRLSQYQEDNFPAIYINWFQAQDYCEWAEGRLPTEAEWEKAARGLDGRTFPWGEMEPSCSLANFAGCIDNVMPVGSYKQGASPYGALDMAGNVWEWVADWYDAEYYSLGISDNPQGPSSGTSRIIRGGSWDSYDQLLRSSLRVRRNPDYSFDFNGFRCVHSP